jgi:hypothetical protein
MPIYDQSYKHWAGSFKSHALRWWVITKYGIRMAFKKKAVSALFVFAILPFVASIVYIYGLTHIGKVSGFIKGIGGGGAMPAFRGKVYEVEAEGNTESFLANLKEEGLEPQSFGKGWKVPLPDEENSKKIRAIAKRSGVKITRLVPPGLRADFYNGYLNRLFLFLFLFLLAVGSGLIAKDIKFNALQIYLAKPITAVEYILGKLGVVVFFLVMITLVPGVLLFLIQAIMVGDSLYLRHYWWVPGAICGYSLLMVFSGAVAVLALSAFSRNVRSAAIGAAALFWFSPMVAQLLRTSTFNDTYLLVSFPYNWTRVGEKIFGLSGGTGARWEWSLLIVMAVLALSAAGLLRRIRAVEVVK